MRFALLLWSFFYFGVVVAEQSPREVDANPALMKQLKIQLVGNGVMRDSLRVPARVDLNQQRVAQIGAAVTGRIIEIRAMLGNTVRKGQTLALLDSVELGMAQAEYLKSSSQVNLRKIAVDRARRLWEAQVLSAAVLQEREGQLHEAEVDMRAASDRLRVMGMNEAALDRLAREKTIHSQILIVSSLDGTVIDRKIHLGQVVQPSDALYTVADLSLVWLVAEVPEQQAQWAREGDEADADVPALPDQQFSGKLIYVADLVNPETRTVTIRMELPNPKRVLKPQMLATLLIRKAGTQQLVIPESAVVREENKDYVFVQINSNRFELRKVDLGDSENGMRLVSKGLVAGEKIVVEGGFHLNNERMRKELE